MISPPPTSLSLKYCHPRNSRITFTPKVHKYTLDKGLKGEHIFARTVSSVKTYFFPKSSSFDAKAIISANLDKWVENHNSKYYPLVLFFCCEEDLTTNLSRFIEMGWALNGFRKAQLGTAMHRSIEKMLDMEAGFVYDSEIGRKICLNNHLDAIEARQEAGYRKEWMITSSSFFPSSSIVSDSTREIIRKVFGLECQSDVDVLESWWSDNDEKDVIYNKVINRKYFSSSEISEISEISDEMISWVKWRRANMDLEPIAVEWPIYSKVMDLAGQVDAVFIKRGEDGKSAGFVIVDWKRVEKIEQQSFNKEKGLPPFDFLPDTNYGHYCCQLNYYKRILERHYGMFVIEMRIVQIHPNVGFQEYVVPSI